MSELTMRNKESYTSLSLIKQCPYQYKLHYVDGIYKKQESIALSIGNLCHKILELQRNPLNEIPSYEYLIDILENGYYDKNENIEGIKKIKERFFEEYIAFNEKSGLNYIDKIEKFKEYIKNYKPDLNWRTIAVELPFSVKYKNFDLTGKIDRVDINDKNEIRVTDYKTANKVYESKDLKTPLQMYVYALAIKQLYNHFPSVFEYDFVVLGEKREAMSKGWESRGEKILDKLTEDRESYYSIKDFPAKPTPLCYYCSYRNQECEYYSLWEPNNKTFSVNKEYIPFGEQKSKKQEFIW